jgi:hypothetical protein
MSEPMALSIAPVNPSTPSPCTRTFTFWSMPGVNATGYAPPSEDCPASPRLMRSA